MQKPMVRFHNTETNEVIDREMTDAEFEEYESNQIKAQTLQAEAEAKAAEKVALLNRLGITAEEAKLLLS
jgi:hypothetical protein